MRCVESLLTVADTKGEQFRYSPEEEAELAFELKTSLHLEQAVSTSATVAPAEAAAGGRAVPTAGAGRATPTTATTVDTLPNGGNAPPEITHSEYRTGDNNESRCDYDDTNNIEKEEKELGTRVPQSRMRRELLCAKSASVALLRLQDQFHTQRERRLRLEGEVGMIRQLIVLLSPPSTAAHDHNAHTSTAVTDTLLLCHTTPNYHLAMTK